MITTAAGVYSCSCGGVAYLGIFDSVDSTNFYKPALVFFDKLGPGDEKSIAEAISHEVCSGGGWGCELGPWAVYPSACPSPGLGFLRPPPPPPPPPPAGVDF